MPLQIRKACSLTDQLFTFWQDNPRSIAIKAVAKANNLELNIAEVESGNPVAEHKKANGLGKIPAFVGEDGFALSECIAIAIYGKLVLFVLSSTLISCSNSLCVLGFVCDDLAFILYSYPCLKYLSCVDNA